MKSTSITPSSRKRPVSPHRGFTVIELMITLAIAGILGFIAIPGMQSLFLKSAATASINQISGLVRYARNEAITHNTNVTLCPSQDGQACQNTPWHDGVILFTDGNTNSEVDDEDAVKRFVKPFLTSGSLEWRSFRNKVQFNGRGMPRGTVGSFVYCPENKDASLAESIVLSFQGRLRLGLDTNNDGIKETGSHVNVSCS